MPAPLKTPQSKSWLLPPGVENIGELWAELIPELSKKSTNILISRPNRQERKQKRLEQREIRYSQKAGNALQKEFRKLLKTWIPGSTTITKLLRHKHLAYGFRQITRCPSEFLNRISALPRETPRNLPTDTTACQQEEQKHIRSIEFSKLSPTMMWQVKRLKEGK